MFKVIVISQKDAHERRAFMKSQLAHTELDFGFLDAHVGRRGYERVLATINETKYLHETGRRVTPKDIGRYISHVLAWQYCFQSGVPRVVLEDDAQLDSGFEKAVQSCGKLVFEYGFIRLHSERRSHHRSVVQVDDKFTLHNVAKLPHRTSGYVISPDAAKQLCEHCRNMEVPIELYLRKFSKHQLPIYGLKPYTVAESALFSESPLEERSGITKNPHRSGHSSFQSIV